MLEIITFEAKIEHEPSNTITPSAVGQAHNQFARANNEYAHLGYKVRGTIITHLDSIDPSAESSLAGIKLIRTDAIIAVWEQLKLLLSEYRANWDLEHVVTRQVAADQVLARLPAAGWFSDALDKPQVWITENEFLGAWPK